MSRNILSLLMLLLIAITTQAQIKGEANYLVKYEVDFVLDSTDRDNVTHEIHRLYSGSSASQYISEGKFVMDSVMNEMRNQARGNWRNMRSTMEAIPRSEFEPIVFKDFDNASIWVQQSIMRDQYVYQEPNTPIEWEFTDESKEIERYTAQKATTSFGGRDYEAWFTLEVPIVDGPYVFSGLPGLILELYDTNKDYHFNVASITPLKEVHKINSEAGSIKEIKKSEFIKSYKKYRENPAASIARYMPRDFEYRDETGKRITSKDIERQAKERVAKRNNLIEIW